MRRILPIPDGRLSPQRCRLVPGPPDRAAGRGGDCWTRSAPPTESTAATPTSRTRDEIDLDHVREAIVFAAATTRSLEALADELGLERPRRILSYADLANRLVSLRLAPERHPVAGDRRGALFADALRAVRRRFDVSVPMKALLVGWFASEAVVPRRLARPLAELFLFPGRRTGSTGVLGRLQR